MSDHLSGPRALAEPIADITDVYAFPSPERPGRLVLVMNTLPFAKPSDSLSDGLIYRFRLRPLTPNPSAEPVPFTIGAREFVFDCVFSSADEVDGGQGVEQEGTCTTPAGDTVAVRVNDEQGATAHGVRVFAGPRWDPFIMDAPAALKTIATGELAFRDPSSIYLDGKNVLSLVVEVGAELLDGAQLVGVVAETLTRGRFNVRLERVGRPEVKNMMLGPKQFDQVNRDLEIRDLYNMENAFQLGEAYRGAYRARLNANLAFWDGLDGKTDWASDGNGDHPLTNLVLADFLVVDVTKPYAERGSFLEIELAALRGEAPRTCGGRALNDDVMDTIFTQLINAGNGPTIRDGVDHSTRPLPHVSLPDVAKPGPSPAARAPPLTMEPTTSTPPGTDVPLELDDIQSGALHERPSPYVGTYLLLRIDDRAAGRELVRRLLPLVDSGRPSSDPTHDAWITVAFTYQGLKALGVPQESLDTFAPEFRQGMAARAAKLGDVGESSPANWEMPLGTPGVHVAIAALSPDTARLQAVLEKARRAHQALPGVELIWRQDCYQLPTGRTSFGFKDGIGQPAVEGSGIPPSNPKERPLKAGEIVLGYPDETGELPPMPSPDVLGRNGTYIVFRKLHTRVAGYRQYLRDKAASRDDELLLRAKIVGRWQSGAPLAVSPERDDAELGADPSRNNDFLYADDPRGFKCPAGAHARRANPRDALDDEGSVDVRLHRMIRRGTSYGPMLPEGVVEDDGADRGIIFVFAGAHLGRQFEFVKTQWLNDGIFIGAPVEKDPLVGANDGASPFTIPRRPIRRRLPDVPPFVVTRGGEYCFAPGLTAMRWLAELTT